MHDDSYESYRKKMSTYLSFKTLLPAARPVTFVICMLDSFWVWFIILDSQMWDYDAAAKTGKQRGVKTGEITGIIMCPRC